LFGREVTGIEPVRGGFSMTVASKGNTETFDAGMVINSAGLYSDEVARMVDPEFPHEIIPFRGEAAKFYKSRRPEIYHRGMNVYPTPFPVYLDGKIARDIPIQEFHRLFSQGKMLKTVGVHLSPTFSLEKNRYVVGDTVTIGPLQKRVGSKDDYSKDLFPEEKFLEDIKPIFPGLRLADISLHQAGIQAKIKGHYDFVIEKCRKHPAFVTLAGIDSPGLTASLAIAKYVKELILN
jgi:glycerol-3-phosphate dehydrogenase